MDIYLLLVLLKKVNGGIMTMTSKRAYIAQNKMRDQKEAIKKLREALSCILDIGKRDMSNPKYDGYFRTAKEAIKDTDNLVP